MTTDSREGDFAREDAELIMQVRNNNADAFGELWRRHHGAVMIHVRRMTSYDPEEITQEAFARVFMKLSSGHEVSAFRAYAIRTARNIAIDMSRQCDNSRTSSTETAELDRVLGGESDRTDMVHDRQLIITAYQELPERYRQILWLKDAEDQSISSCAITLKLSPGGTTTLLRRAREAFKQSWIGAHLSTGADMPSSCHQIVQRLPKYQRGKLTADHTLKVEQHLLACSSCSHLSGEARSLSGRLSTLLILGGAGAAGLFSKISSKRAVIITAQSVPTAASGRGALAAVVTAAVALPLAIALTVGAYSWSSASLENLMGEDELTVDAPASNTVPPYLPTERSHPKHHHANESREITDSTEPLLESAPTVDLPVHPDLPVLSLPEPPEELPADPLSDTEDDPADLEEVLMPPEESPKDAQECVTAPLTATQDSVTLTRISGAASAGARVAMMTETTPAGPLQLIATTIVGEDGTWELLLQDLYQGALLRMIQHFAPFEGCVFSDYVDLATLAEPQSPSAD